MWCDPFHRWLSWHIIEILWTFFYASAFRRRRHFVFGLSVCPSVRSLKYPLLTCTWVRWSTRPTVTILRHVRPSVRPDRFPGICRRTHGGNGLKFYMLMYLDHLQNWLVYGHSLLIFLIFALFWLSETGQIWGLKFCMLMYLDHLQNWLDYGCGLVIWLILVLFWLSETGQIWGFQVFSGKPIEEMAWKFCMRIYPDHFQNWLDYGYSL